MINAPTLQTTVAPRLGPIGAPQGSEFATEPSPAARIGSVRKLETSFRQDRMSPSGLALLLQARGLSFPLRTVMTGFQPLARPLPPYTPRRGRGVQPLPYGSLSTLPFMAAQDLEGSEDPGANDG